MFHFNHLINSHTCIVLENLEIWLADEMVRRGRPLKIGDIVLTGALGPMVAVQAGEEFKVAIDGFDSISVRFSA